MAADLPDLPIGSPSPQVKNRSSIHSFKRYLRERKRCLRRWAHLGRAIDEDTTANQRIGAMIDSGIPTAIAKIGNVELAGIFLYHRHRKQPEIIQWGRAGEKLFRNAGVFPREKEIFIRFSRVYLQNLGNIDLLGVWFNKGEAAIVRRYAPLAQLMGIALLSPPFCAAAAPWSEKLAGKRVLVIHPFAQTIQKQYLRREQIWPQCPGLLPAFTLHTIQVPLSRSIAPSPFKDWFETMAHLKTQMMQCDFDVALIGAGAWSLPLACHAKNLGRQGIHLGGATQMLFGIKGHRWERYYAEQPPFYNPHWVRPSPAETPSNAHIIEKGCYW